MKTVYSIEYIVYSKEKKNKEKEDKFVSREENNNI